MIQEIYKTVDLFTDSVKKNDLEKVKYYKTIFKSIYQKRCTEINAEIADMNVIYSMVDTISPEKSIEDITMEREMEMTPTEESIQRKQKRKYKKKAKKVSEPEKVEEKAAVAADVKEEVAETPSEPIEN